MNALLKPHTEISSHYWMRWGSPSPIQIKKIKQLPMEEQQRVLMLHSKSSQQLCKALEIAITSGNYLSITLNRDSIPLKQHLIIELLALRNHTHINWITRRANMNSACQLTLI
jgi:hypothetical protein